MKFGGCYANFIQFLKKYFVFNCEYFENCEKPNKIQFKMNEINGKSEKIGFGPDENKNRTFITLLFSLFTFYQTNFIKLILDHF